MDIKSIVTKSVATVLSLPVAGAIAAAPADAMPGAPLPAWFPGQYSASWVDLDWVCSLINGGPAFQIRPGNPDTWRCANGRLVPLIAVDRNLNNIIATQYRWGGFSTDPHTAFVHINAGNDCFGNYDGRFFQPDGW